MSPAGTAITRAINDERIASSTVAGNALDISLKTGRLDQREMPPSNLARPQTQSPYLDDKRPIEASLLPKLDKLLLVDR